MKNISIEQLVFQGEGHIVSDMDGEKVMFSIQNGKYYNLGEIGGEIWELIREGATVHEVILEMTDRYNVNKTECKEQVLAFIAHLYEEDLVIINN
ncbi:lasso peptide biosynthesis PqqD family chaperone [Virgibacillus oceani]